VAKAADAIMLGVWIRNVWSTERERNKYEYIRRGRIIIGILLLGKEEMNLHSHLNVTSGNAVCIGLVCVCVYLPHSLFISSVVIAGAIKYLSTFPTWTQ